MLNDLLTLTKIREGDIKAFEDVFRRYYSKNRVAVMPLGNEQIEY